MKLLQPYFMIDKKSFIFIMIAWFFVGTFAGVAVYGILDPILLKHSILHQSIIDNNYSVAYGLWTTNTCGYAGHWIHIDINEVDNYYSAQELCMHEVAHEMYWKNAKENGLKYNSNESEDFAYNCMYKDDLVECK